MADKAEILSVRVTGELAASLQELAREQGRTVSDVLRDAARRAVRESEPCSGLCSPATASVAPSPIFMCACGTPISSTLHVA